jgi:hypothetical protein
MLQRLCAKDEDINALGDGNMSPLDYACIKGHRDVVARILSFPNAHLQDLALARAI